MNNYVEYITSKDYYDNIITEWRARELTERAELALRDAPEWLAYERALRCVHDYNQYQKTTQDLNQARFQHEQPTD